MLFYLENLTYFDIFMTYFAIFHDIKMTYFGSKNDIKFRGLLIIRYLS